MTPAESLEAADALLKRAHAYQEFEEILISNEEGLQTAMALYLADATKLQREPLLACLSDRETEIQEPALVESIRRLLTHPDTRLRRMAGLALFSSGELGEAALGEEMGGKLPKEIAIDLIELFRIASGL